MITGASGESLLRSLQALSPLASREHRPDDDLDEVAADTNQLIREVDRGARVRREEADLLSQPDLLVANDRHAVLLAQPIEHDVPIDGAREAGLARRGTVAAERLQAAVDGGTARLKRNP